jgi:hypothetical protein
LEEYGNWQAEILELRRKIPNFQATEIGKFYSHKSEDIWWYYYVYGSIRGGPRNKVAERCVGRRVNGDVAVVKSGPEEASNYPDDFTRTDLVKTAAFYRTEDPSKVFGEREGARASIKYGVDLPVFPNSTTTGLTRRVTPNSWLTPPISINSKAGHTISLLRACQRWIE